MEIFYVLSVINLFTAIYKKRENLLSMLISYFLPTGNAYPTSIQKYRAKNAS